ncbi:MAG: SUMF1/EgtB/PvdO family nonheme iron enzyme [Spirochaetales bacterium]|nr:SUMF1/EgtB/PvdO family nonheme iron enzyme [Spirochaetales bacterium]
MFKRVKKMMFSMIMASVIAMIGGCSEDNVDLSINMVTVPVPSQGITFPTGVDDKGRATINYVYEVGETPVTWELWKRVYDWATSSDRGSDRYFFQNPGKKGGDTHNTYYSPLWADQHPVTNVSWRDSMVWCNAVTEWYNAMNGFRLEPVYRYNDVIVRDSRDRNAIACDNVVVTANNGFRLPSSEEWELAARWRNDEINTVEGYSNPWFTRGDSASGAIANWKNADATGAVAWYGDNSRARTHSVATKQANSLGIYDMSGNVWEWSFTGSGSFRQKRCGSWSGNASYLQIGSVGSSSYDRKVFRYNGFRLFRTP